MSSSRFVSTAIHLQFRTPYQVPAQRRLLFTPLPQFTSFSTSTALLLSKQQPQPNGGDIPPRQGSQRGTKSSATESNEVEIPIFSLDGLGLSKNGKRFVIGILCVLGTIETWFWCRAGWRWWKGGEAEKFGSDDAATAPDVKE
jgi:hypothetical protein